jgi:hypothetical protein
MYQKFYFKLVPKAHPYIDEESSTYEAWGKLNVMLNENIIIEHEWDMIQVIEWVKEKRQHLLSDLPFWDINKTHSLAEFMYQLYPEMDILTTPESEFEKIESYLENHTFKLRGTDMPLLYIGLIENDIGQLSFQQFPHHYIAHKFDMQKFIAKTEMSISTFIKEWKDKYYTQNAYYKIMDIELKSSTPM